MSVKCEGLNLKMDYSLQRGQSEHKQIENVSGLKRHSLARFFNPMPYQYK